MAHELIRLTEKLCSEPLLITPAGLEGVMSYLTTRNNSSDEDLQIMGGRERDTRDLHYVAETKTGVISVAGPLSYLEYQPMCAPEQASYQKIEKEFDALVEAGAKIIVFDYDTPGGQAYGVFETAQRIRRVADENNIKLLGYVDGSAYSAGYALLSAMHEKIGNPDCGVGSIGVLVHLQNVRKAKQAMGIEDVYVYAGKNKIPFESNGEFKEAFINKLSKGVYKTYDKFTTHVAVMTGIDKEDIIKTQADTYDADEGLELGLLDSVMTREEFFSHLADVAENREDDKSMLFNKQTRKEDDSKEMSTITQEQLSEVQAQLDSVTAANEALTKEISSAKELNGQLAENLAESQKQVKELQSFKEEAEKKAAESKVAHRKAQLSAVLAEDKVDAMYSSTEALNDEAFATVLSSLGSVQKAEEESDDFSEQGFGGEVNGDQLDAKLGKVGELIAKNNSKAAK